MKVEDIIKDNSEWIKNIGYESQKPIVSVLLPTFRRAKDGYFEKAVQSVLNQTFKNLELIIIDDASTDGTKNLIDHFMKIDSRIQCIRHKQNVGLPAISEYEGYVKARGEYIAFIFDDNEWEKEYISKTLSFMVRKKLKASFGVVKLYYGKKDNEFVTLGEKKNRYEMNDIFRNNLIGNAGVLLHREVIENVGLYDPHISIKRICDWDLWRRIFQKYDFEFTNINASSEHGFKLKDSLGNTENLDVWVGLEQMSEDRDALLLPKNFLNYDIFRIEENNTELFIDTVEKEIESYYEKKWFQKNKIENFYKLFFDIKRKEKRKIKKRITVVFLSLDATANVSFLRYSKICKNIIFRFENKNSLLKETIGFSDAFIFMRGLEEFEEIIEVCKEMKIPCYYYIDDNFMMLLKDINEKNIILNKNEAREIKRMCIETSKIQKYNFEKILCSTKTLKKFFLEKKLHTDIEVLNPIIDKDNINIHEYLNEEISIAFMGGSFRNKVLKETVLPAIIKLSKEIKVNFYYPKSQEIDDLKKRYGKGFQINFVGIEKTFSLPKLLKRFSKYNIDILVHCGSEMYNGIYKTENSLLNAVQLGAVLLTSNIEPYKTIFNNKNEYIRVENHIEEWYLKLKELSQNKELRKKIYLKSYDYCNKIYSGEIEIEILESIVNKFQEIKYIDFMRRYRKFSTNNENLYLLNNQKKLLKDANLNFSGLIKNKKRYNIKCDVKNFKTLGLLFASYGEPKGHIIIRILKKGVVQREVSLDMETFVRDKWTYVDFNPINESQNKIFTIELEFFYEKNSVLMGVFENTDKRNFKYKLLNKLRYPAKGLDVLYVDCK